MSELLIRVKQLGNLVKVTFGNDIEVFYEVSGVDLPEIHDYSFAVWHALPHALTYGLDIHVDGPVDPKTLANARRMSLIWEMWQPSLFSNVCVTASEDSQILPKTDSVLTLMSGGIDSTYMLVRLGANPEPHPILTVHGMDQSHEAVDRFAMLLERTAPLRSSLNYFQIVLRTDAKRIARGHHGWGMLLGGHAHMFSSLYRGAQFAADASQAQDFLAFPWGSNHVTTPLMSGSNFTVSALFDDVTRSEKVGEIYKDPIAMQALSFCQNKDHSPENCGRCKKCIRTKMNFVAATGNVPDIFVSRDFGVWDICTINLRDKIERLMFIDAYHEATKTGAIDDFPAIRDRFDREIRDEQVHEDAREAITHFKNMVKALLGTRGRQFARNCLARFGIR